MPEQTAQTHGLMRARPPDRTLRWLVDAVAPDAEVGDIAVMPGGSTAAMHRVTIRRPTGITRTVVLRRYVLDDILDETPDIVTHEAHALELVAPLAVPTPDLLAQDPSGEQTDAPALVMSALEGRPAWETLRRHHLDTLAEALVELHSVPPEALTRVRLRRARLDRRRPLPAQHDLLRPAPGRPAPHRLGTSQRPHLRPLGRRHEHRRRPRQPPHSEARLPLAQRPGVHPWPSRGRPHRLNCRCVSRSVRYPAAVSKTSVEVDRDIASQAAAILGTTTLRETIHASLVEVVNAQRRLELLALLGEEGRFDFDAAERAWGGDD